MKPTPFHILGLMATLLFSQAMAESTSPPAIAVEPSPPAAEKTSATTTAQPVAEPTKPCFQCNGAGQSKCSVPSCVEGQRDCPGECLKLSTPGWQHLDIPGHSPDELWMKFPDSTGGGSYSWTQKHIGQVVKRQNGRATITEICPVCKGTAHVPCTTCNGKGIGVCSMCGGSKTLPQSWTSFDNPKMKNRPSHFKLKDGSEIIGRKVIGTDDSITVRTEKGTVEIKTADLVSEEKPAK